MLRLRNRAKLDAKSVPPEVRPFLDELAVLLATVVLAERQRPRLRLLNRRGKS